MTPDEVHPLLVLAFLAALLAAGLAGMALLRHRPRRPIQRRRARPETPRDEDVPMSD